MSRAGITKTWSAKKRVSVSPAMMGPPRTICTSWPPIRGVRPAIDVRIPSPQYASWSKRRTWPVNAMPRVTTSSTTPTIHVSSLGYLKAPKRKTWIRWIRTSATMKFEPHPWTPRRNQPSGCSWFRTWRLRYASSADGT